MAELLCLQPREATETLVEAPGAFRLLHVGVSAASLSAHFGSVNLGNQAVENILPPNCFLTFPFNPRLPKKNETQEPDLLLTTNHSTIKNRPATPSEALPNLEMIRVISWCNM